MGEQMTRLSIPKELNHSFFFGESEIMIDVPKDFVGISVNFLYELLFYHGIVAVKPWEKPEVYIPVLLAEWEEIKGNLEGHFKARETKGILPQMKKGIGLFIQLLFWSNQSPSVLKDPLKFSELPCKPVNVGERLEFILSRPTLFPSYSQLTQLFVEQEKLFAKARILKQNDEFRIEK